MSVLAVNSIVPANPGSEDYFFVRKWVNFNGTGAVSIRAAGGVSAIFDDGTGLYILNFVPVLAGIDYSPVLGTTTQGAGFDCHVETTAAGGAPTLKTTSQLKINTTSDSSAHIDSQQVYAIIAS